MRFIRVSLCAVLGFAGAAMAASPSEPPPDFLSSAQQHIAAREYWASRTSDGLQAPNREQNLRTWFEPSGIRVHDRTAGGSPRLVDLRLARIGRGDALAAVAPGAVTSDEGRVEIRRENLVEWYLNSPDGLEQGFTLAERPAATRPGDLVLELSVTGASARRRGDSVAFATGAKRTLRYGDLVVRDAKGRKIAASFDVVAPDRVRLVVADSAARYPLVVDPLLTQTADTTIATDRAGAALGYRVASAGDVNGDGYDDVIIGVPFFDDGAGDHEGIAIIFHGGAGGITSGGYGAANTVIRSTQPNAELGVGVASAGDVDGDGYGDVIVGAPRYDVDQINEGAAFVFLGGPNGIPSSGPGAAAARFESDQTDLVCEATFNGCASFGRALAAGDFDGDGRTDILIGAAQYDDGQSDEGAAFVFLTPPGGIVDGNPQTASAILEADWGGSQFGFNVAATDVNGDAIADVIVGAYRYGPGQEGAVFVYHGSLFGGPTNDPDYVLESGSPGAYFGFSVGAAGDVNGDGYGDVIVGSTLYDGDPSNGGGTNEGGAFVFRGGPNGLLGRGPTSAETILESNQSDPSCSGDVNGCSLFGWSVAGAGDVNGDGYADVIVGAPYYDVSSHDAGAAFVFLGSSSGVASGGPTNAFARLLSDQNTAEAGYSVASAGDVNGDGFADVIVGARSYGYAGGGAAMVYQGSAAGMIGGSPSQAHAAITSTLAPNTQAHLGTSVASAGDVNGDGYGDIIVGAYEFDAGQMGEGAAFVFLGSEDGIADVDLGTADPSTFAMLESNEAYAYMGTSVAGAGDVNGDGFADVIVGAPGYGNGGGGSQGAAFIFHGSPVGIADAGPLQANTRILGQASMSSLNAGDSVASAGDVNGDGYADVILSGPGFSNGQGGEGAAFLFLGSPSGIAHTTTASASTRIELDQVAAGVGIVVASAGDVNGDGFSDVIIGAKNYDDPLSTEGAAFVFHGSASGIANGTQFVGAASAQARLEGNQASASMGDSAASAGDVNGDGYADVIVGANAYNAGQSGEGAAFVFYGSPSGVIGSGPGPGVTQLESNQSAANLGNSVASAGDVNGDGYADVIVGATQYTRQFGPAIKRSAAFVFLGSANGIASAGVAQAHAIFAPNAGDAAGSSFSVSRVAAAGDVNGDGFADVIVGAPNGQKGAFVFLGSTGRTSIDEPLGEGGRTVLVRQLRGDGSGIPVQPLGLAHSGLGFTAEMRASHPDGVGRVRLEVEACPPSIRFGDAGCVVDASPTWTSVGPPGEVVLSHTLHVLAPNTLYRWRARVQYAPPGGTAPISPRSGPWRRVAAQAAEGDIRTGAAPPACSNYADDDGDGTIDFPADPGCSSASDTSEQDAALPCDDGIDNDADGATDFPADGGCANGGDPSERSATLVCDNGIDDDNDGLTDFPADPDCASAADPSEQGPLPACSNGIDDDGDGLADFPGDPGCASANDDSEKSPTLPCDDGIDNDGDGRIDYRTDAATDPGCKDPTWTLENPKCQNGINDDGQTGTDFDGGVSILGAGNGDPNGPDPQCANAPWRNKEAACGLGAELALVLPLLALLRSRRRMQIR